MATTDPIRDKKQLKALGEYFIRHGQLRNYVMVVMGVHTLLRISDLLQLKWSDVYDEERGAFRTHIDIIEKKTGKRRIIALNKQVIQALCLYLPYKRCDFIFVSNRKNGRPISRVQAWRIIHMATAAVGVTGRIACHSLRKTWGYHACRSGKVPLAVIVRIYNHSSFAITMRYLGVEQDDIDQAYLDMEFF